MATPRSSIVARLLRAGLLGGVAGASVLGLDLVLMRWTLGYTVGVDAGTVLAYLIAGTVLAGLAEAALAISGAPVAAAGTGLALTAALLYLPAIVERVHHVLSGVEGPGRAVAALVAGSCAYLAWLGLLKRLSVSARWALLLGAVSAALALAVNRNLAPGAFSGEALVLDGAIAGAAMVLALAERVRGAARAAAVAGLAGLAWLAWFAAPAGLLPRDLPTELPVASGDNLFLIVIDTLRLDVFDDVVARTPEGERFARALEGATWFDNATAIAPWTAPSMGSILTGLYPSEHGFVPPGGPGAEVPPLSPRVETLAEQLQRQGYHCEGLVTQPYIRPGTGMERGFAHYELLEGAGERLPLLAALTRAGVIRPQLYQPAESVRRRFAQRLARLEGRRSSLFFFLHLLDPHVPLHAHPELRTETAGPQLPADEDLYRQEVRYSLGQIAGMIELLEAKGLLGNSVVAVTSDHGELFPRDARFGRRRGDRAAPRLEGHGAALYGELVRVPLVVRLPTGPQGRRSRHTDALASHVDLAPTFLELLGLAPRPGAERFSLAAAIAGAPEDGNGRASAPSAVNVAGGNRAIPAQIALRNRRYWLIHYLDGEQPDELFDLATDPGERHSLAAEQPELLAAAREELEKVRPWMTPPPARPAPTTLDETTRQRLKALGYL